MKDYIFEFERKFTFEKRQEEASRIKLKYPTRIPIILEKNIICKTIDAIDKKKFLVPGDLTMGQFQYVVRKRLNAVSREQGLFFFINNTMIPTTENMSVLYSQYKNEDGFLYILFSGENTFG
jgi:GABA(A) receptor-associated protein